MKIMIAISAICMAVISGWFIWGPVLHFFLAIIPPNAQYAWAGKIFVIFGIGWLGGLGIPLFFVVLALMAIFRSDI